jgi:hypothetical protein
MSQLADGTVITTDEAFYNYAAKIYRALDEGLKRDQFEDPVDVIAIMFKLSTALKKEELAKIIAELQESYPALKEVTYSEKVETAENYDDKIERYVVFLIKNGRAKEALEFPTIAKSPNFDIEQYPEFKNFNQ